MLRGLDACSGAHLCASSLRSCLELYRVMAFLRVPVAGGQEREP